MNPEQGPKTYGKTSFSIDKPEEVRLQDQQQHLNKLKLNKIEEERATTCNTMCYFFHGSIPSFQCTHCNDIAPPSNPKI
jgi:hypothetical protein